MRGWIAVLMTLTLAACAAAPENYQLLMGFNNPESAAFSADGKWLFVTNCGSAEFGKDKRVGFVTGEASIARVSVRDNGLLAVEKQKLVQGLTGTLGITVAPQPFGPYPAGSLFVALGGALATDENGVYVSDAKKLGTGVAVFDPETGATLGRIDLGVGSTVAFGLGHPILLPNGIAFDGEGGLLVADTGVGGDHLEPKIAPKPGILRLTVGPKGEVTGHSFTPVAGMPNGVAWNAAEKAVYWVTCGGNGPEGGAVFRNGKPIALDLGPCDGIVFTPAGTVIVSRFKGDLVAIPKGGKPEPLPLVPFKFPSDIKLRTLPSGESLIVVPEQEAWNATPYGQGLKTVKVPAGY